MFEYISGATIVDTFVLPDGRKIVMLSDTHRKYTNCKHVGINLAEQLKLLFKELPDVKFDLMFESVSMADGLGEATRFSNRAGLVGVESFHQSDMILKQMQTNFDRCFYSNPQSHAIKRTSYPNCESNVWYHDINIRALGKFFKLRTAITRADFRKTVGSLKLLLKTYKENTVEYNRDVSLSRLGDDRLAFSDNFKKEYAGSDYWDILTSDEDYAAYNISKPIASNLRSYEKRFGSDTIKTKIIPAIPSKKFNGMNIFAENSKFLFDQLNKLDLEGTRDEDRVDESTNVMIGSLYSSVMYLVSTIMDIYAITRMDRIYENRDKINAFPDIPRNIIIVAGGAHIDSYRRYFKFNYPRSITKSYTCGDSCSLPDAERCIKLDVPLDEFFKNDRARSINELSYLYHRQNETVSNQYFSDLVILDKKSFIEKYITEPSTRLYTFGLYIKESMGYIKKMDSHLLIPIIEDFIKAPADLKNAFKYGDKSLVETWYVSIFPMLTSIGFLETHIDFVESVTEKDSVEYTILTKLLQLSSYEFVSPEYITNPSFYIDEGLNYYNDDKPMSWKRIIVAYINNNGYVNNMITYTSIMKTIKGVNVDELMRAFYRSLDLINNELVFDWKYSYERIKALIFGYFTANTSVFTVKSSFTVISSLISLMTKYGDSLTELEVFPIQWDKIYRLTDELSDNRDINSSNVIFINKKLRWKNGVIVDCLRYSLDRTLLEIIGNRGTQIVFDTVTELLELEPKVEDGSYDSVKSILTILSRYRLDARFYKAYTRGLILSMNIQLLPIVRQLITDHVLFDWDVFEFDSLAGPDGPGGYNKYIVKLSKIIPNLTIGGNTTPFIYQYLGMKTAPRENTDLAIAYLSKTKPASITMLAELAVKSFI
jgi:hypothetical protein